MANCPWNTTPFLSFFLSFLFVFGFCLFGCLVVVLFLLKRTGRLPPGFKSRQIVTLESDSNLGRTTVSGSKIKYLQLRKTRVYPRNKFQVLNLGNIMQGANSYFTLLWMYINKCMSPITMILLKGLGVLLNSLKDIFFIRKIF